VQYVVIINFRLISCVCKSRPTASGCAAAAAWLYNSKELRVSYACLACLLQLNWQTGTWGGVYPARRDPRLLLFDQRLLIASKEPTMVIFEVNVYELEIRRGGPIQGTFQNTATKTQRHKSFFYHGVSIPALDAGSPGKPSQHLHFFVHELLLLSLRALPAVMLSPAFRRINSVEE